MLKQQQVASLKGGFPGKDLAALSLLAGAMPIVRPQSHIVDDATAQVMPGMSRSDLEKILRLPRRLKAKQLSLMEQLNAAATQEERTKIFMKAKELLASGSMSRKSFTRLESAYTHKGD